MVEVALRIVGTAMVLSFVLGLAGMLYDACSSGVGQRTARLILIAYLWPLVLLGSAMVATGLAAIWGALP